MKNNINWWKLKKKTEKQQWVWFDQQEQNKEQPNNLFILICVEEKWKL